MRVSDGNPEMLRYLADHEILPGAELLVARREPFGAGLVVESGGVECPIGPDLALRMSIERGAESS